MAITYINSTSLGFDLLEEPTFNTTPGTGTRLDLPVSAGQTPLVYQTNMIEDDTQRPNRETAAPTRGHESSSGSLGGRFRVCDSIDLLLQSGLAGRFDAETGMLFGGEEEISFSMFTRLADNGTDYLGYLDSGVVVSKFGLTASAKEGVNWSADLLGTSRVRQTTKPILPVDAVTAQGFNYKDVKNITVGGQTVEFIDLAFESSMPKDHRIVFGAVNATSIATTGNRANTLTLKGYRKGFQIDTVVGGNPVEVKWEVGTVGNGYRFRMPYAMCNSPTDELNDTGLLINLQFTGHWDETSNTGIIVEKL